MQLYPYSTPIILTDNIFLSYGGQTGTTIPAQRQAAYLIAEQVVSTYLGTLLLPTRITGSANWQYGMSRIVTEYGYVNNFVWIRTLNPFGEQVHIVSGTNRWATIYDDTFGYVDIKDYLEFCGYDKDTPYKFQYVYDAGLPTGSANNPSMLMALTGMSQIVLNELAYPTANESTGDAGVEQYTSLDYSETRKKWKNTALGASARSAFLARMIDSTFKKARRALFL